MDPPVVPQPGIDQRREYGQRVAVVGDDRLARQIGRRHHQRVRARVVVTDPEEQNVQRRVGKQQPEVGTAGRHGVGHPGTGAGPCGTPGQEHDRATTTGQKLFLVRRDGHQLPRHVEVRDHHRERLAPRRLRPAQFGHGRRVAGVAHQVVPAEPLDRDDPAVGEELTGGAQRVLVTGQGHPFAADQFEPGPAVGAGDGLGVEAPVARILVLRPAGRAHLEVRHRGRGPVVRQASDDREPGTAVRAGDEGVAVAPVRRVRQLVEAVAAGGDVGRDEGPGPVGRAGVLDGETLAAARRQIARPYVLDDRERRGVGPQPAAELLHGAGLGPRPRRAPRRPCSSPCR